MKMPILIVSTIMLLAVPALANEFELDEEIKARALILGYVLNGNSMVRPPHMGAIDVSSLIDLPLATTIPPQMPSTSPADVRPKGLGGR